MARTVKVSLQAEVGQYKRGMGEAERATDKLSDALEEVDGKASGMADAIDDAADRAADDFDEVARHARKLDDQIDQTERGIRSLAKAFAETGDPKILAAIKQQQAVGRELANVRNLLPKDGQLRAGGAAMAGQVGAGFGATLVKTLPAAANPAMIGVAAGAAPVFISAFSSALAAGAGVGLIGVGLAAVAKDPVVKLRGAQVGKNFTDALQEEAREAFGGPVMGSLDQLDAAGKRVTAQLGDAFDMLAPHVEPFTRKVIGAGEAITGSLVGAARNSGPAIDGLGDSVTLLGDGVAFFVDTVADGGPQAADNLRLIAGATADLAKHSASVLSAANQLSSNPWITGPLLPLLKKHYKDAAIEAQRLEDAQAKIPPELELTSAAARGQRDALLALSNEIRAQTDPAFALLNAQQQLKKAQDAAAAAVKKHGRNSTEARAATRDLALAALDLEAKTGALGSSFNGKLTPAMRNTYKAAGLTETQIKDVEKEFVRAKRAGDKFDGAFTAAVNVRGDKEVFSKLDKMLIRQQALNKGISISAAGSAFRKNAYGYAEGGWTGPGAKYQPAGIVHADEYVIPKASRRKIERKHPGLLDEMRSTGQVPGYAAGGRVTWPYPVSAANAHIMSMAEALSKVAPSFGNWPSSPSAQRGDSGVWRKVLQLIRSGPKMGSFGNAYRPGDPKWHGSGRAVDWMGYNMDGLAKYLAAKRPLELIHRTKNRDYAYTRGRNMGSFSAPLMNAHRNHIHIAMAGGGMINEPVMGTGLRSGNSYSFGERGPERVLSHGQTVASAGGPGRVTTMTLAPVININGSTMSPHQIATAVNRELGAQFNQMARGVA